MVSKESKILALTLTSLFLCIAPVFAELHFTHLTIEDGLSQTSVKCIFQDHQGFIWFGTADGLNKFDGYEFTTYRNDPTTANSISGNDISVIYQNPYDSVLWIGTQDGGLNKFDRDHDQFISYKLSSKAGHFIPSNNIRDIIADSDGKIWIASYFGGIFYYQPEDSTFYQPEFSKTPALNNVRQILEDNAGNLWIGSNSGLYKWSPEMRQKQEDPEKIELDKLRTRLNVLSMMIDYHGNIWTGTAQDGIYVYHPVSKEVTHFSTVEVQGGLASNSIRSLLQTKNGDIWIGTTEGLELYDNRGQFTNVKNHPNDPNSLNNNLVYSIFEDNSGIIWVGTYLGGINKYDPLQARFPKYRNLVKGYAGKIDDIRSIVKDNNDVVWLGTTFGLIEITTEELINQQPVGRLHFEGKNILSLSYSPFAGLFINTEDDIYLRDHSGKIQSIGDKIFQETGANINGFRASEIKGVNTWLATGQGLLKYNGNTKEFGLFQLKGPDGEQIQLLTLALLEDYTGKLWFGTYLGQLYVLDTYTEYFEQVTLNKDLVSFSRIFSLCETKPGEIWMGTNRGLYRLNTETKELKRFLSSDGLANDVVYSVISDEENNIWCSTNNGISCYKIKTGTFINYSQKDGLQSNEFNEAAYFKDSDGIIYMGGINGLNVFHPNEIMANTFIPPVIITSMEIQYEKVSPDTNPELLSKQISETQEIKLGYKQNTFSFEYTALSHSLPERNEYQYCLTKEDEKDEWIYAGKRRFATFTNIDPGNYYFKVKGSNSDRLWNEKPTTLHIIISPPFWQTLWFKVLLLLFLGLVIYIVFYFRIKTIKSQKRLLELRVNEKTRQLNQHKDQIVQQNADLLALNERMRHKNKLLNSQNKQISLQRDNLVNMAEQLKENNQSKIQFYTTVSHELKTPLTLILEPLKEVLNYDGKISVNEVLNKLKTVQSNASKLLVTINQILDFRKMEINKMDLNVSRFDLVSFVRETASHFNNRASKGNYSFVVTSVASDIKIWADMNKIEKIIFNLLSNAFKYTNNGGKISLDVRLSKKEQKTAVITVEDNGRGISEKNIEHIFERFYQQDHSGYSNFTSSGLGLAISKKYIEMHKGTISVKSTPGKGSLFIVELPVGKSHFDEDVRFTNDVDSNKDILISSIGDYEPEFANVVKSKEDLQKPLVLLVETDKELQHYLTGFLLRKYRVELANDVASTLQTAMEKHPDIIVSDLILEDNSALKCCEGIKEEFSTSHIPFVVLSTYSDTESQMEAIKSGADAYLTKPLNLQLLRLTIDNLLENRKKLRNKFDLPLEQLSATDSENSTDKNFLTTAIQHVEDNIDNADFNVETLCGLLNLSQPQVYRKIKALTKLNISEFIRNIRLNKAAQLLRLGTMKVNEVAYQTGFNDPNYFTKSFTKLYGMPPTEYGNSF